MTRRQPCPVCRQPVVSPTWHRENECAGPPDRVDIAVRGIVLDAAARAYGFRAGERTAMENEDATDAQAEGQTA